MYDIIIYKFIVPIYDSHIGNIQAYIYYKFDVFNLLLELISRYNL